MKSKHPYLPFIPETSRKLIIGTIPPPRFCKEAKSSLDANDVNFYYGSRDNSFWPLLEEAFETQFEYANNDNAIQQRKNFLTGVNIGVTDIVDSCVHSNNSASDKDLQDIVMKDLKHLLIEHPSIDTLIYTSEFVKQLVNRLFNTYHSIDKDDNKRQTVKLNGKLYNVRILYSPSPSALRNMGENGAEKRKLQYREIFASEK